MSKRPRIIARLDIKGPNVIKGMQMDGHRVVGTPEVLAETYYNEGIDEIFYQDTVASLYQRNNLSEIISKTASKVFIPVTVAGGIRTVDDIKAILRSGADKVAINTAAIQNIDLLRNAVKKFGSQCIVASIEAYRHFEAQSGRLFYEVWTDYGREATGVDAIEWADRVVEAGVGEIVVTGIRAEGMGKGFDLYLTQKLSQRYSIPVVASGGAGSLKDVHEVLTAGSADAVAIASMFHYHYARAEQFATHVSRDRSLRMGAQVDNGNMDFLFEGYGKIKTIPVETCSVAELKAYLVNQGLQVRI